MSGRTSKRNLAEAPERPTKHAKKTKVSEEDLDEQLEQIEKRETKPTSVKSNEDTEQDTKVATAVVSDNDDDDNFENVEQLAEKKSVNETASTHVQAVKHNQKVATSASSSTNGKHISSEIPTTVATTIATEKKAIASKSDTPVVVQQPPKPSTIATPGKTPEISLVLVDPISNRAFSCTPSDYEKVRTSAYKDYNQNQLPIKVFTKEHLNLFTLKSNTSKSENGKKGNLYWFFEGIDTTKQKYGPNVNVLPFLRIEKFGWGKGLGNRAKMQTDDSKNTFFLQVRTGLCENQIKALDRPGILEHHKKTLEIHYASSLKEQKDFFRGMKFALNFFSEKMFKEENFTRDFETKNRNEFEKKYIKELGKDVEQDTLDKAWKEFVFEEIKKNSMLLFEPNSDEPYGMNVNWPVWSKETAPAPVATNSGQNDAQPQKGPVSQSDNVNEVSKKDNMIAKIEETAVFSDKQKQEEWNRFHKQGLKWNAPRLFFLAGPSGLQPLPRKNSAGKRDDSCSMIKSGDLISFAITWKPSKKDSTKMSLKIQKFGPKIILINQGPPLKNVQTPKYAEGISSPFNPDNLYEKEGKTEDGDRDGQTVGVGYAVPPPGAEEAEYHTDCE